MTSKTIWRFGLASAIAAASLAYANRPLDAQQPAPEMVDPELTVRTAVSGLTTPIGVAFLPNRNDDDKHDGKDVDDRDHDNSGPGGGGGNDDRDNNRGHNDPKRPTEMFVIEKMTGQVKHVVDGVVTATVLDLAVNSASERGLLGIALHPRFPKTPYVYLYWTCRTTGTPPVPPAPLARTCDESAMLGEDSNVTLQVPLLGNRVDRFVWNGQTLKFDRNMIQLHAFQADGVAEPPNQNDSAQNPAGNHNGGVIRFGPDGKLYIIIGDNGRRGWLQNLANGPTPPTADDQFGGPEPDDAHLTGVVLRLDDDGSTPRDNPFWRAADRVKGEVAENIRKVFAYGFRNSFGMAFDPFSGSLWLQINGDDTFDEIQRVDEGLNSGWIQTIGPISRVGEFKSIETTLGQRTLQQLRWPPTNIADTPAEAQARLFMLPGAHYRDPEFSWRYAVAPAGIGFMRGSGLGPAYTGDLFVGAATPALQGGYLFRFNLNRSRRNLDLDDPGLLDHVADNNAKNDITESETLLVGRNFGISPDIQTGPNGNLFVVSLSRGEILEISKKK
jgi:glucose/arabinose dehydrogenase